MGTDLRVAVAGATGALGGEIVKVLDQVTWRPAHLVALARASTSTSHVDYGEARVPVDDLSEDGVEGADALIVAVPGEGGAEAVRMGMRLGIPTVDCSGGADAGVPLCVPWVNPEALADLSRGPPGIVAVPDPGAALVASVLAPLRRAGIEGPAQAVVLSPASREGKAGIEELSRQVVALFNSGDPPRKVFPNGLAFDLLPAIDPPGEDGWTPRERAVSAAIQRLSGASAPVDVSIVGVPVFSGLSAEIVLRPARPVPVELALRILADGGLALPESAGVRYLPRPRRVEGKPFAHVGRVRHGADGALHVWASMDNLRTSAAAAVALAGLMLGVAGRGVGHPEAE